MRIRDLDPNRWKRIAADLNDICDEICDATDNSKMWDQDLVAGQMLADLERAAMLSLFVAQNPAMTQEEMQAQFIPGSREPKSAPDVTVRELNRWFNMPSDHA